MRELTSKKVKRYFASYTNKWGGVSRKSFGSKMAACRFLAKQDLLDLVFGAKWDTGDDENFSWWRRSTPNEPEERAKMFAKHFPIEECEFALDYYGNPKNQCMGSCHTYGYGRCQVKKWLDAASQDYYWGRKGVPK